MTTSASNTVRDGVTGYPLQADAEFAEGTRDDFELWKLQALSTNPELEISGAYNQGMGFFRTANPAQPHATFAMREGKVKVFFAMGGNFVSASPV